MHTDLEIARNTPLMDIEAIAARAGIDEAYLERYGRNKAKVSLKLLDEHTGKDGKLVLVTAITPTPAGEGKTTTTVGLADALSRLGMRTMAALREPSLGPVFGLKGGAAGGGYAQVAPMDEINLHFTGDFHAVGAANNLLAAMIDNHIYQGNARIEVQRVALINMIDNHIYQGNALNLDPRRITWRRCVDMNDRQLRSIVDGLGGRTNGCPREDGYDITVASEIMAILCLSQSLADLKARLGRIIVGYTYDDQPVTAGDLKAAGAMTALLKEALKPNLVQTLEHTPVLVHGGPFANIAHGCNSVLATRMAMRLADYTVTEAGFGADLGAEKFLDIKCRMAGLRPDAVVIVATVRALKMHGGVKKDALARENVDAMLAGAENLRRHVRNIKDVFGLPCVVAVNRFPDDTDAEIDALTHAMDAEGVKVLPSEVWAKGGEGGLALAREVVRLCGEENYFAFAYDAADSIQKKLNDLTARVYGGRRAVLTPEAKKQAKRLTELGYGGLPVCVAKTQYSFSDKPTLLGAPTDFEITVRALRVSAGAGFVVALTGDIMTMPGLPKVPAAENIDVDDEGNITGLF